MPGRMIPVAIAALFAVVGFAETVLAGEGCCAHCGCHSRCHKVCRLVEEEKKVEITCWGVKCEDFCLPCPSRPGCKHCKTVCAECDEAPVDCDEPHAKPKKFTWRDWTPCGAHMYTKKKLMKKVITEKVPSYKWVVEDLCPECTQHCRAENTKLVHTAAPNTGIPLPPTE